MSVSEDELKAARAALAPTLEAAVSILPWVSTPREPKFPPEKTARWAAACERLVSAWANRHQSHLSDFRPSTTELCGAALDLGDTDLLGLSEAFAGAADRLEEPGGLDEAHVQAAVSAACECLACEGGIESDAFAPLARQVTARLEHVLNAAPQALARSITLDHLFVGEAGDCIDRMLEALEQLPADTYAVKLAAEDLADLADPLELEKIALLARALANRLIPLHGEHPDLDDPALRNEVNIRITELSVLIEDVDDQANA